MFNNYDFDNLAPLGRFSLFPWPSLEQARTSNARAACSYRIGFDNKESFT